MAKTILGIDIGYDTLKLALMSGTQIKNAIVVSTPQSLVKEGRVVSIETMSDLIRSAMKNNGIRCNQAALVLPNEVVFVRNVVMPRMNTEQLEYNLPYEFRDYITEELKDYVYDYAMLSTPEELKAAAKKSADGQPAQEGETDELGPGQSMEVMAAAVPASLIEDSRAMLRKAGLRLVKAAPAVCTYIPLIRQLEANTGVTGEYCILDLGYQSIRMYMFRGDRHIVTRVLEIGLSSLDNVIADVYNVDVHLAHTYLMSNYEDCQNKDFCKNAYNNIAVELMRALNFYRFSNPDSQLADVWLCGGGAVIRSLQDSIAETLDMKIHQAEELFPKGKVPEGSNVLVQAVGITMN